eukprot:Colp12_sorted_trinity150504_noHs@14087
MTTETKPLLPTTVREPPPRWSWGRIAVAAIVTASFVAGITCAIVYFQKSGDTSESVWNDIRLPSYIRPQNYSMLIVPEIATNSFHGESNISLSISLPTDQIVIHALRLNLTNVTLKSHSGHAVYVPSKLIIDETHEYVVIHFGEVVVPVGNYTLGMNYAGIMANDLVGFYISSFVNETTQQVHKLATTKFEPTFARKAFPCFDEPAMKAVFELSTISNPKLTPHVLTNMPEISSKRTRLPNGLEKRHFEPSFIMSTYLVAFVFSDFEYIETKFHNNEKPLRVWTRPGSTEQGRVALNAAKICTEFYEEYFNISYPLPKLD